MEIIKAKYRTQQAFLDAYQSQFLHGGVFIVTRAVHRLGAALVADVRFPGLRSRMLLRGFVAWRRQQKGSQLRPGIGLEFLASERRKRDFLLAVARGEVVDMVHRRHRRLPVNLAVDWRSKKSATSKYHSFIDDIGQGGAFIRTRDFLPLGTSVMVEIAAPGSSRPIPIEGRIAWTHHTPGEEGIGVEFRCRDQGGTQRLKELVRRVESAQVSAVFHQTRDIREA